MFTKNILWKYAGGNENLRDTSECKLCWPWKKFCCIKDSKYIGLDELTGAQDQQKQQQTLKMLFI